MTKPWRRDCVVNPTKHNLPDSCQLRVRENPSNPSASHSLTIHEEILTTISSGQQYTNRKQCSAAEKIPPPPSVPTAVVSLVVFHHVSNPSHVPAVVSPAISTVVVEEGANHPPPLLVATAVRTLPTNYSNRVPNSSLHEHPSWPDYPSTTPSHVHSNVQ